MSRIRLSCLALIGFLTLPSAFAQDSPTAARLTSPTAQTVPHLIRFVGQLQAGSAPRTGPVTVTFSIYEKEESASPLWLETQTVTCDANGRYSTLLGKTGTLPADIFADATAGWIGVRIAEEGQAELPRVRIISVPYSLKAESAGSAESLGGHPASDYLLTPSALRAAGRDAEIMGAGDNGTLGRLARFSATGSNINLIDSVVFDDGAGRIGIGTTAPQAQMEVVGSANIALFRAPIPSAYVGFRLWNDQNNGFRAMELNYAGSAYPASIVNGGPVGEGGSAGTTGPYPFMLATNNTARMVITGGGNIGIGVNSPASRFEVTGNPVDQVARFSNTNAINAPQFSLATPPPTALRADATAGVGQNAGLMATSAAPGGFGLVGVNSGPSGNAIGVFGVSTTSVQGTAVWGEATSTTGDAVGVFGRSVSTSGTGVFGLADTPNLAGDATGVFGRSLAQGGTGVWGESTATTTGTAGNVGVYGVVRDNDGSNHRSAAGLFDVTGTSDILIGRTGSNASRVFRVSSTGAVFGNGAFNATGADFAESVAVREERSAYQPGDVIAIDPQGVRRFHKTAKPYSTLVAGIYSTKPGVVASPDAMNESARAQEIPLAVVGIVPCKVSSENGSIEAGDLLVSSSTPGYAMKATDRGRMTGAVIGKALQAMRGANGVIEVLVSLQ